MKRLKIGENTIARIPMAIAENSVMNTFFEEYDSESPAPPVAPERDATCSWDEILAVVVKREKQRSMEKREFLPELWYIRRTQW